MPTTTTKTATPMNAFGKLASVRREFLAAGAKKSGKNAHAEFMYFELEDIVPIAEPLFDKYGLLMQTSFTAEVAMCQIVNVNDPHDTVYFAIPLKFIEEPAKFRMNEVQGVGAAVTYYRRYLYMLVLDLVEADAIDCGGDKTPTPPTPPTEKPKKPVSKQERKEIKEEITNTDAPADELMIKALKTALKKLMDANPDNEAFVQDVAVATNGFKDISREKCAKIINSVNQMLENEVGK